MDSTTANILLVMAVLIMHLIEEIKTSFRQRPPLSEMPRPVFMGAKIAIYAFCFTNLILFAHKDALAIPLAWIFVVAILLTDWGILG